MTGDAVSDMHTQEEPTVPGWYRTVSGNDWLLYALAEDGEGGGVWSAHALNGEAIPCGWEYIDQAGPVELVSAWPRSKPPATP